MSRIDDFRATLQQGGARPSHFRVTMTQPAGLQGFQTDPVASQLAVFMCKATTIPASRIQPIEVYYRGRPTKVAGERVFDNWNVQVINDGNFIVRNMLESWSQAIVRHANTNGELFSVNYQTDMLVEQLDRNDRVLKAYKFHNCFPLNISEIQLDFAANNTIEEFAVEFSIDYWTSSTTDQSS